jgi:hypothetical protein
MMQDAGINNSIRQDGGVPKSTRKPEEQVLFPLDNSFSSLYIFPPPLTEAACALGRTDHPTLLSQLAVPPTARARDVGNVVHPAAERVR